MVQWPNLTSHIDMCIFYRIIIILLLILQLCPHKRLKWFFDVILSRLSHIAKFMEPTWGPPGSCRTQMGPMLAPWTLLSGISRSLRFGPNLVSKIMLVRIVLLANTEICRFIERWFFIYGNILYCLMNKICPTSCILTALLSNVRNIITLWDTL